MRAWSSLSRSAGPTWPGTAESAESPQQSAESPQDCHLPSTSANATQRLDRLVRAAIRRIAAGEPPARISSISTDAGRMPWCDNELVRAALTLTDVRATLTV
jgi:hypothetical protein